MILFEHRQEIANNVESVEKLTNKIRSLQLERDEDEDPDDHLMLDFTTDLALTMPSILEGDYDQRLATVMRLSKSTAELLTKKSRRLAGLQPHPNELKDKKEQRRLSWNMFINIKEKEQAEKEKREKEEKQITDVTEEY